MDVDEEDVIIEISPNEYQTLIYVTKSTIRAIGVGKDVLKKRIQSETQTTIKCSKIRKDSVTKRFVEIKGATHKNVYAAREQIKAISKGSGISGSANRQSQPTHFTCIKVTDPTIQANYIKLKDEHLNSDKATDTHKSAFMKPEKLHITFGVMCLTDDESQSRAQQILTDCLDTIIKPVKSEFGKIVINVNFLEIMKGNAEKARVLYAKVESYSLQKIANGITNSYLEAGLWKREGNQDEVKLHMTLMNVKYVKPRKKKAKSFDATHILRQHIEFEFGCQEVSQILLVSMKEKDDDGFYKCLNSIDL